jgi:hypothetical protein
MMLLVLPPRPIVVYPMCSTVFAIIAAHATCLPIQTPSLVWMVFMSAWGRRGLPLAHSIVEELEELLREM